MIELILFAMLNGNLDNIEGVNRQPNIVEEKEDKIIKIVEDLINL